MQTGSLTLILLMVAPAQADPPAAPDPGFFPPAASMPAAMCPAVGAPGAKPTRTPAVGDVERPWFAGHLAAAGERSLYGRSRRMPNVAGTTLRFTWLPSFDAPVTVRIEGLGTPAPRLIARQLSGQGGYAPGTVAKRIDRSLSSAEAGSLGGTLARTKVLDAAAKDCELGCDGAEWLVEAVHGGDYRIVTRWSPTAGPVRAFGEAMLRLTGWRFHAVY